MTTGNESDFIYTRDSNGEAFKHKRTSQVVTDKKTGKLREVPKGHFTSTDRKGNMHIIKHFSSARKRKKKVIFPTEDEEIFFNAREDTPRLSQREMIKLSNEMAQKNGKKSV